MDDQHVPSPSPVEPPQSVATSGEQPEITSYEAEPASVGTPLDSSSTSASPTTPPPQRRSWLKWALLVAAIVVLVGGAMVYGLVYQNPQKVITDSLMHALQAKTATYTATLAATGNDTATITLDGMAGDGKQSTTATLAFTTAGKSYTVKGAAVVDKTNDVYVKVTNVNDLVASYRSALPANGQALLDKLVAKINNNWIRLSPTDLKNYNSGIATFEECSSAAITTLQTNKTAAYELGGIYKKHQFITIAKKLGAKNGSLGYELSANRSAAQAFTKEFNNTAVYKALKRCDPSASFNVTDLFGDDKAKGTSSQVEVWVSQWSHQLTSLTVTAKDSASKTQTAITVQPRFNTPVNIAVPTKTTTTAQLMTDIQAILQSALTIAP